MEGFESPWTCKCVCVVCACVCVWEREREREAGRMITIDRQNKKERDRRHGGKDRIKRDKKMGLEPIGRIREWEHSFSSSSLLRCYERMQNIGGNTEKV